MRIEISSGAYRTAAQSYATANQTAGYHYDTLAAYDAMAGEDHTSADFAAAYDTSAQEALDTLRDVVGSFTTLGRLTDASVHHHTAAEAASVLPRTGSRTRTGPDGQALAGPALPPPDIVDGTYREVYTRAVPSSLGGDTLSGLPEEITWILDRIEGFVWPNAETDTLRAAATSWNDAAADLDDLTFHCDSAATQLATQRSPEIALALTANQQLRSTLDDLATEYRALATACDDYATTVEDQRTAIVDLARSLLTEAVVYQGIGLVLGTVTGGLTAGAAAALNALRLAAAAPHFLALTTKLRLLAATIATTLQRTKTTLSTLRGRLTRYRDARVTHTSPTSQRSIHQPWPIVPGGLRAHETAGGHAIGRHVGRTDEELFDRFNDTAFTSPLSSSFTDLGVAERAIARLLKRSDADVNSWVGGTTKKLILDGRTFETIGRCADRAGNVIDAAKLRVVLLRDPTMTAGFRIHTAYPTI